MYSSTSVTSILVYVSSFSCSVTFFPVSREPAIENQKTSGCKGLSKSGIGGLEDCSFVSWAVGLKVCL